MKRVSINVLFVLLLLSACNTQRVALSLTPTIAPGDTPKPTSTQLPTGIASTVPTSLPSTMSEAHDVLVNFLTLLHTKKYADAAPLYGGDYEQLKVFNTEIKPEDHVALWSWACDNQLLQCLEVRSATSKQMVDDSYVFQVEFSNADGSLFVLGPCCGANETEMPPVSQFEYTVSRNAEHAYVVMNMPPYVP